MNMPLNPDREFERRFASRLMDVLIRAGLIVALTALCYRVFSPFLTLMVWALILAVAMYPLHLALAARVGNRQGLAATLLVLIQSVPATEDRIDEDLFKFGRIAVALFVGYEQPIGQIDLIRREADSLVLVHQLDHLFDDFSQLRVDSLQRLRAMPERWVRIMNNLKTQSSSKCQN